MSYEEIDKSIYGTDVFTNGAEGRYAKAKPTLANDTTVKTSERKKKVTKIAPSTADNTNEEPHENGYTNEVSKTKKKTRKVHENGDDASQPVPSADGETIVKPKKKRTPKAESNSENIDPTPEVTDEPVRKKKSKKPKTTPIEEDLHIVDTSAANELELSTEITPKVRKPKKHKTPKTITEVTADTFDDIQTSNGNDMYSINTDVNGVYTTNGDISYDAPSSYPGEGEQAINEPEKSEYETAIMNAYNDLASKVNFAQYVGDDQWCIIHLPKTARTEPKSRIRKMLPGGKDEKFDGKPSTPKSTNQKGGFLNRIRTGVSTLVRDENNLIFGERSNYDMAYFDEEEDGIDTDDLHRYAQKLRELEDNDREVNPEFLVLRDGKTVYGVHEADAEGNMKLSARKPIYDRASDQAIDDEPSEKRKLLSRLKNPFARNKDKDGKGSNSPKSANGTPDPSGKRGTRKLTNKTTDDDMATVAYNDPPVVD